MPFVYVHHTPASVASNPQSLRQIEANLIKAVAEALHVSERSCEIEFVARLNNWELPTHMPWAVVATGNFAAWWNPKVWSLKKAACAAVSKVLMEGFVSKYNIEVFAQALDPRTKSYRKTNRIV